METFTLGFVLEAAAEWQICVQKELPQLICLYSGQTKIKRIATFRDLPPSGNLSIPCGACREFIMQLSVENSETEIITDYKTRSTITLGELTPMWWGYDKLNEQNKS